MHGSILTQASRQWATRPADERFLSLVDMESHFDGMRARSRETVVSTHKIRAIPAPDNRGLLIEGPNGNAYAPSHWAFGQIASRADAPAGYLRTLPAPVAADCVNYGLQFRRTIEDVGVLLQKNENGDAVIRAATGPRYGRIWNADITRALVDRFGDGVTGDFRVPGEFGKAVPVTKENTTLYAGDRDMFVFLADENNRIEIADRRNGQAGSMARGFFVWNSEVGSATFGIATFLFDYVCKNRIVWGAREFKKITIRHTASAPDRFLEEIRPALLAYSQGSARTVTDAINAARNAKLEERVDSFLADRFGKRMVAPLKAIHEAEENRPIESLWDVSTAATAYARGIEWQDERVAMERAAGDILDLAAA